MQNPVADGRLVAESLRKAGFAVRLLENLTGEQFRRALTDVSRESETAAVTLVYYAGHGVQVGGVNYLIPVDLPSPQRVDDIRFGSISADDVLSAMHSPIKVLVLDACRDNPVLSRSLARGRGMGFKRGLARIAADDETGVFIAYSTAADTVAEDGAGANSPFAEAFAKFLGSRVSIDDMFVMVTREVEQKTKGQQRPFKYASLDTVFCLPGNCLTAAAPPAGVAPSSSAASAGQGAVDAFKQLFAAKTPELRGPIELWLFDHFRNRLPKHLPYAPGVKLDSGGQRMWFFEPATARSDGHQAVSFTFPGLFKDSILTVNEAVHDELAIDCNQHEFAATKSQEGASIKFFTAEEQRAKRSKVDPASPVAGLVDLLCDAPLRFTPLWAVDQLVWTDVGDDIRAATGIRYNDPSNRDIWYLLTRFRLAKPDAYGVTVTYHWPQIDCKAHTVEDYRLIAVDKNGVPVYIQGVPGKQMAIAKGSVAENLQVILCDKPSL